MESTPKHSDKLEIALNALGCLGEVDQLGGMNMRKKLLAFGQPGIKCLALFRQVGAVAHLPIWIMQEPLPSTHHSDCEYAI